MESSMSKWKGKADDYEFVMWIRMGRFPQVSEEVLGECPRGWTLKS
jgi:hypothetical protein